MLLNGVMRHSGRILRPPGKAFPDGLLPDLWGFGAEKEPHAVAPPNRRAPTPSHPLPNPPSRPDPLAGLIDLIGKLFA